MLSERLRECGVVGAGGAGFPTYVKAQSQVEYHDRQRRRVRAADPQGRRADEAFSGGHSGGHDLDDGRRRREDRQVRHQDQERGIAGGAEAQPENRPHRVRDAGRFLPFGRRVRTGLHGDRAADSAGGHPAAGGLRGEQRGDALQRAPGGAGPAGDAEVSLGVRRGERAEIVLGAGGHAVSRAAGEGRRRHRGRTSAFSSAA